MGRQGRAVVLGRSDPDRPAFIVFEPASSFLNSSRLAFSLHCLLACLFRSLRLYRLYGTSRFLGSPLARRFQKLMITIVSLTTSPNHCPQRHAQRRRRNTFCTDGVAPRARARDDRVLATLR